MNEAISTTIAPLIGLPCWNVGRVHGSMISLEFGAPRLHIREPIASQSPSARVRERMAQRQVRPVGEWNLCVSACHWRVIAFDEKLAEDADAHERIEVAVRTVDGQKLTEFVLDTSGRTASFVFDLGATLTIWPYKSGNEEQWSLYRPDGFVLTYRTDGQCSLYPGVEEPKQRVWHTVSGEVRVL